MTVNDTSIIALFQRRSEAALSELMRQYGRLLRQLARNILPTEEDAEECVNDAVLDVWNSIPPQQPRSLSAYACSLVRNRRWIAAVISPQKNGAGLLRRRPSWTLFPAATLSATIWTPGGAADSPGISVLPHAGKPDSFCQAVLFLQKRDRHRQ